MIRACVRQPAQGEALELADKYDAPIHLLVTDLVMPKISGRELSERIVGSHPEIKVVFISGYSNNLLSSDQVLDPKHILLKKPFRLSALGHCIREVLNQRNVTAAAAGK